ncbi:M50 family metallopeptidase [Leptolyngbya sp. 15MV]|nr:M50 family metallopeptidase [Leptolyngbya sp. 15MV]
MSWQARPATQQEQVGRLILAGVLVTAVPQLPLGNYLLYPFVILTTWFHEMGHGLVSLLLGHGFEQLIIFPDGSGVAESSYAEPPGALTSALVAAGGPLGPSVAGSLLILASGRHERWRPALLALAGVIALSVLIWVRSTTGLVVLPLVAAALGFIALRGRAWAQSFTLQFLGVLAALSMFRDWNYLFSYSSTIGGVQMLSDTGAMQEALALPYWLWAGLIVLASGAMIGASLKHALRQEGGPRRWK